MSVALPNPFLSFNTHTHTHMISYDDYIVILKYTTNHCQGGKKFIYWKKKKKPTLSYQLKKKSKDTQLVGQKKKTTVRAAKLQCKKCSILSRAK